MAAIRFQSAVEDHLQGVTHIIRGKDLMDSTCKQKLCDILLDIPRLCIGEG